MTSYQTNHDRLLMSGQLIESDKQDKQDLKIPVYTLKDLRTKENVLK